MLSAHFFIGTLKILYKNSSGVKSILKINDVIFKNFFIQYRKILYTAPLKAAKYRAAPMSIPIASKILSRPFPKARTHHDAAANDAKANITSVTAVKTAPVLTAPRTARMKSYSMDTAAPHVVMARNRAVSSEII